MAMISIAFNVSGVVASVDVPVDVAIDIPPVITPIDIRQTMPHNFSFMKIAFILAFHIT
jgi:hypothetical protein